MTHVIKNITSLAPLVECMVESAEKVIVASLLFSTSYGETWRNRLTPKGSQPMAMHSRRIPHCIANDTS